MNGGRRILPAILTCIAVQLACARSHDVEPIDLTSSDIGVELAALDDALDGVQIVLLGENGHGVKELTEAKVRLIEWLHREHGFDVVVFESGLYECDAAWRQLADIGAGAALRSCLRYPFEHAEALPLFELMRTTVGSERQLSFAGMDFQAQGFDSQSRPEDTFRRLETVDSALASRLARADTSLFLLPQQGGLGDSVYVFAYRNADRLIADYRRAAELTTGTTSLVFRLAEGWIERLAIRGRAEVEGEDRLPARFYELRDEWMARAIAAFADSIAGPRRVIAWLHNDHARYGRFPSASDSIRSTGGYLKDAYGDRVLSIGFFFGRGTIADNSRRPRTVVPLPENGLEAYMSRGGATYLVLRANGDPSIRSWANTAQAYLRMGIDTLSLTPAREFDALFYIDSVSVPSYRIPD